MVEVAGGYQLRTPKANADWVKKFLGGRPARMGRATLETLAIIAYRQPITKAEIEAIRGVDVDGVITTLLERNLIRAVARKDVPGRPFLYGTTPEFLQLFNLKDLSHLPTLKEMEEISLPEIPGETISRRPARGELTALDVMERLQKILARAGLASRREAERWIVEGRITVNGSVVRKLGSQADPAKDSIKVDGKRIKPAAAPLYYAFHKPPGMITTLERSGTSARYHAVSRAARREAPRLSGGPARLQYHWAFALDQRRRFGAAPHPSALRREKSFTGEAQRLPD